jgi:hypothetical protein
MRTKLVIPIIAWTLIASFCIAVLVSLGVDEIVPGPTAIILAITALVAAVIYLIDKQMTAFRLRNPTIFESKVERVQAYLMALILVAVFLTADLQALFEWFAKRKLSLLYIVGVIVIAALIFWNMYELVTNLIKGNREPAKPRSAEAAKRESQISFIGSAIITIAVVYAVRPLILPSITSVDDAIHAWIPLTLWGLGIWGAFVGLVAGTELLARGQEAGRHALPNNLPTAVRATEPRFDAGGYWHGTCLANEKVWSFPVPVLGRGYWNKGSGRATLGTEVLAFLLKPRRNPLMIPYALIHMVSPVLTYGNRKPVLQIVWGRPDMPMVTTIQVTRSRADNEVWAQEISRRSAEWKAKTKASR